jgi:hypothetical protein
MLDERAKRKPNWSEQNSVPVVLADGQPWSVPKPWLEIRPVFRDGRAASNYPVLTYGPDFDELLQAMADCEDRRTELIAIASLAARLLRWHYDLSDADLAGLLAFRAADAASTEWAEAVIGIATGSSGPKVKRAGGD